MAEENRTVALGSDHVGVALRRVVGTWLAEKGWEVRDVGAATEERSDYPVFGVAAAKLVRSGACRLGIVICGTGVGISLAANKVRGIRCAVCSEPYTAALAREHNDANMLAMGARVVGSGLALMIVRAFVEAQFEGGRHQRRIDMLAEIEASECSPS